MKRMLLLCLMPATLFCAGVSTKDGQPVGHLKVKAYPDKAGVYVDGAYYGPAARFGMARKYAIAPGEHTITLVDPRFQDGKTTVQIEEGKTTTVSEALTAKPAPQPPFATLRVACKKNLAAVLVNGEYVGHVDEFNGPMQGLELSPGTYDVRIDVAGSDPLLWQRVTLEAGKTTTVRWDD